jgi:hypothetical protein
MTLLLALILSAGPPAVKGRPSSSRGSIAGDVPKAVSVMPSSVEAGPLFKKGKGDDTECAHCHVASSWTDVRFNHERTGFPLTGAHSTISCKTCHVADFKSALPRNCIGCHRDSHAGDLGTQCESCHDTTTWRSRVDIDAHRRTNFPLVGGHAGLPCVECHFEAKERRFARATVDCMSCHQQDWSRTVGTALDHQARQFDTQQCRTCHGAFRFSPALFPGHDVCYVISSGAHAGVPCKRCHVTENYVGTPGGCNVAPAACTSCHEHDQAVMDEVHRPLSIYSVYAWKDLKCYECHQPP